MTFDFMFFFNNILLGVGLAMDAFSVSLANGLNEPCMKTRKMCGVAGLFAFFQGLMPMLGWICVHTIMQYFQSLEKWIPWIALALLGFIGGKMLHEGIQNKDEEVVCHHVGLIALLVQGIATSGDPIGAIWSCIGYTVLLCFTLFKTVWLIYLPSLRPYFVSAVTTATGLAWKSGVAAEVISVARHSMGEGLYEAKLALDIPALFAWTGAIVAVSVAWEKLFMALLNRGMERAVRP